MPTQHAPNPNNRQPQTVHNIEPSNFLTFSMNSLEFNYMHLRLRREVQNPPSPIIIEHYENIEQQNESKN